MQESMYDKLGELLSGALDSGFIPQEEKKSKKENSSNEEFSQNQTERKFSQNQENSDSPNFTSNQNFYQKEREQKNQNNFNSTKKSDEQKSAQSEQKDYEIIKFLPENVKIAFAQIKIPENATFDEAKKIYREKLKYYHPDTKNDNPILQKVAKEKTENLLSNWKIVEEYFKSEKT